MLLVISSSQVIDEGCGQADRLTSSSEEESVEKQANNFYKITKKREKNVKEIRRERKKIKIQPKSLELERESKRKLEYRKSGDKLEYTEKGDKKKMFKNISMSSIL